MNSILFLQLITLLHHFQNFWISHPPILNGKQNSLTGPVITGRLEKQAPDPRVFLRVLWLSSLHKSQQFQFDPEMRVTGLSALLLSVTVTKKGWLLLLLLLLLLFYYMALSHKDWELPNSRIWLAKTDIDRGQDFPI